MCCLTGDQATTYYTSLGTTNRVMLLLLLGRRTLRSPLVTIPRGVDVILRVLAVLLVLLLSMVTVVMRVVVVVVAVLLATRTKTRVLCL